MSPVRTRPKTPDYSLRLHIEAHDVNKDEYRVLNQLFKTTPLEKKLFILPFKGKKSLKAAAEALAETYPNYYYLIDRDYADDNTVKWFWDNFSQKRIIMWRKRCIENYFLSPAWLVATKQFKAKNVTQADVEAKLCQLANQAYLKDALAYVYQHQEESTKRSYFEGSLHNNYLATFTSPAQVDAYLKAVITPAKGEAAQAYQSVIDGFKALFFAHLSKLAGQTVSETDTTLPTLTYGQGEWLNLMNGKTLWTTLCGFYDITTSKALEEMMSVDPLDTVLPDDFKELSQRLLAAHIK
jgi:hypothetical protein